MILVDVEMTGKQRAHPTDGARRQFSVDMVDPLYELTDKRVNRRMSLGTPPQIVRDYPSCCFTSRSATR